MNCLRPGKKPRRKTQLSVFSCQFTSSTQFRHFACRPLPLCTLWLAYPSHQSEARAKAVRARKKRCMGNHPDKSNGYEEVASLFIAGRGSGNGVGIGASVVARWASTLPLEAAVLDLGCGTGDPITRIFIERGLKVYAVDASPSMVVVFQARFPSVPVQCAAAEESNFFGLSFDAVVSWGLFFLLQEEVQRRLIAKVGGILRQGGRFLFTAPQQRCSWRDAMTERVSVSLGNEAYQKALEAHGMRLDGTASDEGENYYYVAQKL